ncbi:MAG TPA: hypothetical protein VEW73_02725 [Nocardioides sp.]|nr:hypothetical protein [Nocardioides sp.]
MQLLDSTAAGLYLAFAGTVIVLGLVLVLAAAPVALRETRSDRKARRESIPAYYGRLHFAH